jgi:hypothetical protein
MRRELVVFVVALVSLSSVNAQSASPARPAAPPKAVYTPKPEYRPEWAKQGLTGKGIVLVTIDKQTAKVTGAQMPQSTGNTQLDGSALEAYGPSGIVYEKDLGADTLKAFQGMERFNPDKTWQPTNDEWPAEAISAE